MIQKKQYYNSILKQAGKGFYTALMAFMLLPMFSASQSCECPDCPAIAPANTTTDFEYFIEGAVNNDLADPDQGVCAVVVEFIPDHIWSLEMVLTSPGGQQVTLIGPEVNQFGFTGPFAWQITFLPCNAIVAPDPGFAPVWDNDQPWALGAMYSGSYYPNSGCLEDFNIGSVDGAWTLSVINNSPINTAQIIDFSVVFCDDEGLDCFECEADAGSFQDSTPIVACFGDTASLILDLEPDYGGGNNPDPFVYGYTYIISQQDIILAYDPLPDLSGLGGGVYTINGFAYRLVDSVDFPPPNGNNTITSLNEALINLSSSFCGDVTETSLTVTIIEIDTTFLTDTLCAGESFVFGIDSLFVPADTIIDNNDTIFIAADTIITALDTLTASGVYTYKYASINDCDSIVVFDLTVREEISTVLFDTICAEDTYLFDGIFYQESGTYTAVFPAESLCDSTVTLNLLVKDSIITYLNEVICIGESYTVGNNTYTSTGISTNVFNSAENCDSIVILDLTVLEPTISIVPPDVLDCIDSTVVLDGSGSTGEALVFEWFHVDNGNDGIISGENEAIAVVNKTGNYLLVVTDTLGGNECVMVTSVGVGANINPPHIIALGGSLDCNTVQATLTGISITPGAIFSWTGPGNFTSDEQNPSVNQPGDYILTVTGPNGCESQAVATVDIDTLAPQLSLAVSDTLDCNISNVQLSANAVPAAINYSWTGPNNFSSNQQNPSTSFPGVYILTAETPNGCTAEATVTVEENFEAPDAAASGDTLNCNILQVQLEGNSTTPGATYSWTGPNNFTSIEQNPTVDEPGTYFLTVQGQNGCETIVSATVEQDILNPDATASGDTLNCNISTVQLTGSSITPDVIYSWTGPNNFTSDEQNPQVTASGEYFLTVQSTNGCTTITSAIVEEDFGVPDIEAAGDTLDCNNSTAQLNGNSATPGATYSWTGPNNFTSVEQHPVVDEAGIYTLFVTGPNGCESQLEAIVEIDTVPPQPFISAGDTLDCNIASVQLFGGSVPTALSYIWIGPNNFLSDEQNPETSFPGEYLLIITGMNGCTNEAEITVIQDLATPDASATGDTLFCNVVLVQIEGNSATPGVNYSWTGPNNFSSTDQNPIVVEPGEYFLTVEAENGCQTTVSTWVEADVGLPGASATGDTLNCTISLVQLQGNSPTPDVEYSWVGPNNFTSNEQNPLVDSPGVYLLSVLAINGCVSQTSATVAIDTIPPELLLSANGDLDCNVQAVQLFANSTPEAISFSWTGPNNFMSNEQNPEITEPGDYFLLAIAGNGCQGEGAINVIQDFEVPDAFASGDTLDCDSPIGQLNGVSPTPDVTYNWIGPNNFTSTLQNPQVTEPGQYFLTVEGANGCGITVTTYVEQDTTVPDATANGDTINCFVLNGQLEGNSTTPDVTFNWIGPNNFTSTLQNPLVSEPGEYFLTVQAENGCETTVSAIVVADLTVPDATANGDTINCTVLAAQLEGNSTTPNVIYTWTGPNSFISGLQNPVVTAPGEYFLTVQAENGCETMVSAIVEEDNEVPDATAIGDTLDCDASMVQLLGNSSTPGVTYNWTGPNNFISNLQNPVVTLPGEYFLTVQAENACQATTSAIVEQDESVPDISAAVNDTLDCAISVVQLQGNSTTQGVTYGWTGPNNFISDEQSPVATEPGEYILTVTSPNDCEAVIVVMVTEDVEPPVAFALGDSLDCNNPTGQLEGNSTTPGVAYSWLGPNNFTSNEQSPVVTEPGEYILTVLAENGCETTVNAMVEEDAETPDATASGDTLFCGVLTVQLEGNSNTPGVIYSWTGPNNFTSNEQSPEVTAPGEYFLTVLAANGCETTVNAIVIADVEVPDVTAVGDTLDCNASTVQLQGNSTFPGVIYTWTGPNNFNSNEQNPFVTIPGEYILTVLAANGCSAAAAASVEQDADVPNATAVGDTLNCTVLTVQLQGNSSTPGVTYSWTGPNNFSSDEQNPEVTDSGVYILTVTSPNDCEAITSAEVFGDFETPDASAVGDSLDCIVTIGQLQGNSTTPGVEYSWTGPSNFTSDEQNPQVTAPGEYFLTVIAQNGCETTVSAQVTQDDDVPDVSAVGDTLDCIVSTAQLQGNSTTPGVIYNWTGPNNFSSDEQNPQVTEPGEYFLTVTSPGGCNAAASVFVIENADAPDVLAVTDTLSCVDLTAQLQGSSATPGVIYSWTGPNSFSSDEQNPEVTEPGDYTLIVNAPNGCSAEMTVEVPDISELIIAEAATSDSITCENNQALISGAGSSTGNNIDYLWLNPASDSIGNALQQTVTTGGLYTLIVSSNYSGCSAETQVFVEENTNTPVAEINTIGNQSITCQNTSVVLSGEGSGSLNEVVFEWFFGGNMISNEVEIQVAEAGDYTLQVTNILNGCFSFDTTMIEVDFQLPEIDIDPPAILNCVDTLIQLDATNSSTGIEFDYQWISLSGNGIESGATTLTPTINLPGEYVLIIENTQNGCLDSASVIVISNTESPLAEAGEAADLNCENQTIFLNGSGSSTGSIFNYLWTGNGILDGADSLNPEVNQTGVYTLLVTNTENGCTAADEVTVGGSTDFVSGAMVVAVDPDCFDANNGSILVENVLGGDGPYLYSIGEQVFVQNNFFSGLAAGEYEVSVMDEAGCVWDTLIILNPPTDILVSLGEDALIALGDSFNLDPQVNVPFSQIDTFFWEHQEVVFCDTCFDQWVTPFQTTSYSITVLNENGCRSTDEIVVRVEKKRLVYIPTAFSPNNDGNNDVFVINGGQDVLKINTLQIFSRWGAVVFEQNDFQPNDAQFGWDGTHKNQPLNPDVFVYFAEIEFIDGRVEVYKGDITLLR